MSQIDYTQSIRDYICLEIQTLNSLSVDSINLVMNTIHTAYENESNIYIFGNGGSAATASHFQNDFNKGISEYVEKKFRFVCLNDNIPTLMAISNDIGYEAIFEFQLKNKLKPGDLVIGISGSGNSPNVLRAVEYANTVAGVTSIGVTGYSGGKLKEIADISLHVQVNSMQVTEDIHMVFDHLMMSVFYKTLAGKEHLK